ncbi:MAG TPA: RluA family pseudouridine synthase [Pirellulales bacterium]|nr:RluA family pseudouridine synthase [Pirellulales bacterium]
MQRTPLDVLYEDNHLLAVNKPAGIATQGAPVGRPSLLELAKAYVKRKYHKPGNVYLGTVSRLDSAVSGVVVFARTSKAARRLSEQFRDRATRKLYWAAVSGEPAETETCVDWLVKDESHQRMCLIGRPSTGGQLARLSYRRLRRLAFGWLLEIELQTGRKHQIRVQLAARGLPILGDRKYGSREPFASGIALHSRLLELAHPTRPERIVLTAEPPPAWRSFGVS